MCGITGIYAFNMVGRVSMIHLANATQALAHRGPDFQHTIHDDAVGLGHRRLSVIDPSPDGHQPMTDSSGRYSLVYNGEIYNYRELRSELEKQGITFRGKSDTEVLLHLLIRQQREALQKLNGFFSFALYDREKGSVFMARDRMGIKPLYYYSDNDRFLFASEMRSLLAYGIEKEIDMVSLKTYLQLNYIPAPRSILRNVKKLMPGEYIYIDRQKYVCEPYYELPTYTSSSSELTYEKQQEKLADILEEAVRNRLVADVPLGSFLSGGIDSSVVAALAARHKDDLHTFSIGYSDEPYFDETNYAEAVAKKIGSRHHVFKLSGADLLQQADQVLQHIDEPFADSSAIAVNILSMETRKHVTVALSGDGADELFGGYNKHEAFMRLMKGGTAVNVAAALGPLWSILPKSRNNALTNLFRQLDRLSKGKKLTTHDRYWRWASFTDESGARSLLSSKMLEQLNEQEYREYRSQLLSVLPSIDEDLNDILRTDQRMVLPDDMLTKVDRMSMAHNLEVRVPFLDHKVVAFVNGLPVESKISGGVRKRILQDTFRDFLPLELYNRPKKGFEVPLLKWLRREMQSRIENDLLSEEKIRDEGLFNYKAVKTLLKKLHSSDPGDSAARIWGLVVYQSWNDKLA
jgi:asparagine synthase (glutamine-hydrolysing)